MTPRRAEDELGEELKTLEELTAALRTVVVLRASHRPLDHVTAWLVELDEEFGTFYMGVTKTTFFARIRNGKLFDDLSHQIHVYRWKDPNEETKADCQNVPPAGGTN